MECAPCTTWQCQQRSNKRTFPFLGAADSSTPPINWLLVHPLSSAKAMVLDEWSLIDWITMSMTVEINKRESLCKSPTRRRKRISTVRDRTNDGEVLCSRKRPTTNAMPTTVRWYIHDWLVLSKFESVIVSAMTLHTYFSDRYYREYFFSWQHTVFHLTVVNLDRCEADVI